MPYIRVSNWYERLNKGGINIFYRLFIAFICLLYLHGISHSLEVKGKSYGPTNTNIETLLHQHQNKKSSKIKRINWISLCCHILICFLSFAFEMLVQFVTILIWSCLMFVYKNYTDSPTHFVTSRAAYRRGTIQNCRLLRDDWSRIKTMYRN